MGVYWSKGAQASFCKLLHFTPKKVTRTLGYILIRLLNLSRFKIKVVIKWDHLQPKRSNSGTINCQCFSKWYYKVCKNVQCIGACVWDKSHTRCFFFFPSPSFFSLAFSVKKKIMHFTHSIKAIYRSRRIDSLYSSIQHSGRRCPQVQG